MMTKVCQITCVHDRYDTRIFHKIARSLANHGFDSFILCIDNKENENREGVSILSVKFKPKNRVERILKSWKKLRTPALELDADIYQLHDPELLPLGKYLIKHNKKVIFDSHEDGRDIGIKPWIPRAFRKLVCKLYLSYEKRVIKKLSGCISVDANIVERLSKSNNNCVQITNYPFLPPKTNYSPDGLICYAGSPESYAQFEFISALSNIGHSDRYCLITNLSDQSLLKCEQISDWNKISKMNYLPFEELEKIYAKTSLGMSLAYPDIGTDYWNGVVGVTKFFEFLAYGIPIICSSFTIWKDIIDKYKCGIYADPFDINEIITKLDSLLNNRNLMIEMSKNARKAAEEEFNWKTQEIKLLDYYEELLRK